MENSRTVVSNFCRLLAHSPFGRALQIPVFLTSLGLAMLGSSITAQAAPESIKAALAGPSGDAFVFRKDQKYIAFDTVRQRVVTGPDSLSSTPLARYSAKIVAAFADGNLQYYFLNNGRYVGFDAGTGNRVISPTPIGNDWDGVGPYAGMIRAALRYSGDKVMFFLSDGTYLRYDLATETVDPGYPRRINNRTWPGLGGYGRNIRAAVRWGADRAFVFLDRDRVVEYDIVADEVGPQGVQRVANHPIFRLSTAGGSGTSPVTPPNATIKPQKGQFTPSERIVISFSKLGAGRYFVVLLQGGIQINTKYTPAGTSGTLSFGPLGTGIYEAVLSLESSSGVYVEQDRAVFGVVAATVSPPSRRKEVDQVLDDILADAQSLGLTHFGAKSGKLRTGGNVTVSLGRFERGYEYWIVATGDSSTARLGLTLIDGNGKRINSNAIPSHPGERELILEPSSTQIYKAEISMRRCNADPCSWGLLVMREAIGTSTTTPSVPPSYRIDGPRIAWNLWAEIATVTVNGQISGANGKPATLYVSFDVWSNGRWEFKYASSVPGFASANGQYAAVTRHFTINSDPFNVGSLSMTMPWQAFGFNRSGGNATYQMRMHAELWVDSVKVKVSPHANFAFTY